MRNGYPATNAVLCPRDPRTGEAFPPRDQPGYYAGFSTLSQSPFWDDATRTVVEKRVAHPPPRKFFSEEAWNFWTVVFSHLIPQTDRTPERQIAVVAVLDHRLSLNETVGYRYENMPLDRVVYEIGDYGHRPRGRAPLQWQISCSTVLTAGYCAQGNP